VPARRARAQAQALARGRTCTVSSEAALMRVRGVTHTHPQQGDLFLHFQLLFPSRLTQQQKMLLAAGLFLPPKPNTAAAKALRELEAAYKDSKHGWASGIVKGDAAAAAAAAAAAGEVR
jgi:hypothetical protein